MVEVLLQAGADPCRSFSELDDKTALHAACAAGAEDVAVAILRHCPAAAQCRTRHGLSPFEVAEQSDMRGLARRLRTLVGTAAPDDRS